MSRPKEVKFIDSEKLEILKQSNLESNIIAKFAIEDALILLLKEKPFKEISITEIVKKAGVSRATYYRNYSSKEEILSEYLNNIADSFGSILKDCDVMGETEKLWKTLFAEMKLYSKEIMLLFDVGYGDELLNSYIKVVNKEFKSSGDDPERYYFNCYWVGAFHAMIKEWILNGMKESIDTMVSIATPLMKDRMKIISGIKEDK